jgi:hypothetical protein
LPSFHSPVFSLAVLLAFGPLAMHHVVFPVAEVKLAFAGQVAALALDLLFFLNALRPCCCPPT